MLRIVSGGKDELSEENQVLYADIQYCIKQFDEIKEHTKKDVSKNYLVMAYNLFELKLPTEALKEVDKITEMYWVTEFLRDLQFAIDRKNEMEILKDEPDCDRYLKCKMESEFFICGYGIIDHIKESRFTNKDAFDTMLEELEETEFTLIMFPEDDKDAIEIVSPEVYREDEEKPKKD